MPTVKLSENRRLILLISLLLVVGFLVTSLASYFVSREAVRESIVSQQLPLTSDNIYSEIQRDLFRPVLISSVMAHDTFLRDWALGGEKDLSAVTRYLTEIMGKYGVFTAFYVSERTRVYYHAKGVLKKVDAEEPRDAWYFRVRSMKEDYEINVDPDMANRDAMTIFINYRVFDYKGNYIGVTGVGLTVDAVRKYIEKYRANYRSNIFFVDRQGRLVLTGEGVSPKFLNIREEPGYRDMADRLLATGDGRYEYKRGKGTVYVNARFVKELKWYLLVEREEDPALEGLRKTLYGNLLVCLLVTAVALTAMRFTVNRYQARVDAHTRELEAAKERAESATRLKDKFVSLVSHNIRGPLATVIGFINISLQDKNPDGSFKPAIGEWLKRTEEVCHSLVVAVGKILDISRFEQGAIQLNKFDVSGAETVKRVFEKASSHATAKQITLHNELPDGFTVHADYELFSETLLNLVSNAIKFTEPGGSVTVYSPAPGVVAVKDTGIGVHPALMGDLFKSDVFTSMTGTAGEKGTGLGLTYCRDIMKAHGGSIWAESSPAGSVFFLEFPPPPSTDAR